MSTRLPKHNSDINAWITLNNFHNSNNGGKEWFLFEQNSNNPPTLKSGSHFSVYKQDTANISLSSSTGNNEYSAGDTVDYLVSEAIFEGSDNIFSWNNGNFPIQSDGTWYLYCAGNIDTDNSTIGKGDYGATLTAPSYSELKGGYYLATGERVLCSFVSSSGVVSDITAYIFNAPYIQGGEDQIIITKSTGLTEYRDLEVVKNNLIINPDGEIAQRDASFSSINDDTYGLDRWIVLSDGNGVVNFSRNSDSPARSRYSMKLDVATINKKFGILQIIESSNSHSIIDGKCSLSFYVKTTTGNIISTVGYAVLSWSGASDNVTSDVVSSWGASGVDPTLVANWTYEASGETLLTADIWQKIELENISIDTVSTENIAVFIWSDDTSTASGDELYISRVQLNEGEKVSYYEKRGVSEELEMCQRYYEKSYNLSTPPGSVDSGGAKLLRVSDTSNIILLNNYFNTRKRVTPSISIYSPITGAISRVYSSDGSTDKVVAGLFYLGEMGIEFLSTSVNITDQTSVEYHYVADAEL